MIKPKAIVLAGYGLNCEEETKFAFELAGGNADIVHINDCIDNHKIFSLYQLLAIPGGFAYGDDTGSGNAYAQKLKNHLWDDIMTYIHRDTLTIGICNGCQILVNLGLVPAIGKRYGKRDVALIQNNSARYTVRWTDCKNGSTGPWLSGIDMISLPIAHGEGKFCMSSSVLASLKNHGQIALRYQAGEITAYEGLPVNPTGTLEDIAALTDETKRILGIMPHPERAIFFTQLPHWTYLKEQCIRDGKSIPIYGPGLRIFQNAIEYFSL